MDGNLPVVLDDDWFQLLLREEYISRTSNYVRLLFDPASHDNSSDPGTSPPLPRRSNNLEPTLPLRPIQNGSSQNLQDSNNKRIASNDHPSIREIESQDRSNGPSRPDVIMARSNLATRRRRPTMVQQLTTPPTKRIRPRPR